MDLTDVDYRIIRSVARWHARSSFDRDDLVQEAAIRLWRETHDPARSPREAFVAFVARCAMRDYLRVLTRSRSLEHRRTTFVDVSELPEPATHDNIDAIDARMDWRRAMRRVPKRARKAVMMRFLRGMEIADVEQRLSLAPQTYHYFLREDASMRVPAGPWSPPRAKLPQRDPATWVPRAKPSDHTPEKLRALVPDMPAFLASLSPVRRGDITSWLAGQSVEAIAKRYGVTTNAVRGSIYRAFERARSKTRRHDG